MRPNRMSDRPERSSTTARDPEQADRPRRRRTSGARRRQRHSRSSKLQPAQVLVASLPIAQTATPTTSSQTGGAEPAQALNQDGLPEPDSSKPDTTSIPECNISKSPNENPEPSEPSAQRPRLTGEEVSVLAETQRSRTPDAGVSAPTTPVIANNLGRPLTFVTSTDASCSTNAVRVLFRDRGREQVSINQASQLISQAAADGESVAGAPVTRRPSNSVVNANRRLIERQIEAIQVADSRRWNFDFRNCRPLYEPGKIKKK